MICYVRRAGIQTACTIWLCFWKMGCQFSSLEEGPGLCFLKSFSFPIWGQVLENTLYVVARQISFLLLLSLCLYLETYWLHLCYQIKYVLVEYSHLP